MIADAVPPLELESFLDTLPAKLYRTRLVPPYDTEFLSGEAGTVVGYAAGDFRRWRPEVRGNEGAGVASALT